MKKLVSILILCLLFLIACANTTQIPKSLSSSYDGIWDGYAQMPDGQQYIKIEITMGIVSGFFEYNSYVNGGTQGVSGEKKINGYITSENNLIFKPIPVRYRRWRANSPITLETNLMSPDRIEGTYHIIIGAKAPKYDWYVVKPATGKSDGTISNVEGN